MWRQPIFHNSETLDWKNENKKTEFRNSEILLILYNFWVT